MLTNHEWRDKIGFVPSPAARAGATPWGIGIASEFKGEVTNPGLENLLDCRGEWGDPWWFTPREIYEIFSPLGEKAPRLIKDYIEKWEGCEPLLYAYLIRLRGGLLPPPLPDRRWRSSLEYARYVYTIKKKTLPWGVYYEWPPDTPPGVEHLNSEELLLEAGERFRNCALSYSREIKANLERIVVVYGRIMVRYEPTTNLLLEAKYKYNEVLSDEDLVMIKNLLNLS
jgi:hypothetical protein